MNEFFSEQDSAEIVIGRTGLDADPRLREVVASLLRHLHAFAVEVKLTQDEWAIGIDFLTATGKMCEDNRQEFILLSDVLGLSMLVDAVNNRRSPAATENTVLGPFYVAGAPRYPKGSNICLDGKGETCLFTGRVTDLNGNPINDAVIDVWSDNAEGYYDVQQPNVQPRWNNRGIFHTGPDGNYEFRGIRPVSYPIPDDGPVGKLLQALGRHPNRPAHMHFIVKAAGFESLVTHIFVEGDRWLTSDAVFGVKESLVTKISLDLKGKAKWSSVFNFVLQHANKSPDY